MRVWCVFAIAIVLAATGCLRGTSYRCASDGECVNGTQGRCEAVGYCSFPDPVCPDGNRFAEGAGPYANQCVMGGGGGDAAIDAPACAAYMPIGASAHRYRLIGATAGWSTQRNACVSDGGYLAIPDDALELADLAMFTVQPVWIGVHDRVTEGTYVTVQGAAATFLPWQPGQPDNNQGADCVIARLDTLQFLDDRCTDGYRAICECDP